AAASASTASRSHTGGAAATGPASARSVVAPRTTSQSISVSATPARDIPASDAIRPASTRPVAKACTASQVADATTAAPTTHAGSSTVAAQIATLPANLLASARL